MAVGAVYHCLDIYIILDVKTGAAVAGIAGAGTIGRCIMGRLNSSPDPIQEGMTGGTAGNFAYSMLSDRGIGVFKGLTMAIGTHRICADPMTVVAILKPDPADLSGPVMVQHLTGGQVGITVYIGMTLCTISLKELYRLGIINSCK